MTHRVTGPRPLPRFLQLWFAADAMLALLPPIHWAAGGSDPTFGVPRVLIYLIASSVFISASVVVAYLSGRAR